MAGSSCPLSNPPDLGGGPNGTVPGGGSSSAAFPAPNVGTKSDILRWSATYCGNGGRCGARRETSASQALCGDLGQGELGPSASGIEGDQHELPALAALDDLTGPARRGRGQTR